MWAASSACYEFVPFHLCIFFLPNSPSSMQGQILRHGVVIWQHNLVPIRRGRRQRRAGGKRQADSRPDHKWALSSQAAVSMRSDELDIPEKTQSYFLIITEVSLFNVLQKMIPLKEFSY